MISDAEGTGGADLQRKLDLLNGALDAERAEQARRQLQYVAHSGYSEDSDYTSDLNFPVGQHPNCSASQFRNAAHQMHTPQRSLEASRENSYEREEYHLHGDTDPLYYNSQPRTNRIDTWSQLHAQASVESAISWRTAADWQSAEEQRRPSLERQNTLYDDGIGFGYDPFPPPPLIRDHPHLSHQPSYEEYFDAPCYPYPFEPPMGMWDQRFFYDECGLNPIEYENFINKRRSSVVQLPQMPPKQLPPSSRYSDYNEMAPYRPRPRRTAASLPATPSSTPKRGRALPVPPGSESGWGRRGRRLPRPPTQRQKPVPPTYTNVPYKQETERIPKVPDVSYGYETFGYQKYQDTAIEQYQDNTYTTSDEDGMQPFFNETPHATPSATTAQKSTWGENESSQFSYTVTGEDSKYISTTAPSKSHSKIEQPVTTKQSVYDTSLSYETQYNEQQYQKFDGQNQSQYPKTQNEYQRHENRYEEQKTDLAYHGQYNEYKEERKSSLLYEHQSYQQEHDNYQKQNQYHDQQYDKHQQSDQYQQDLQQQYKLDQQLEQQQQYDRQQQQQIESQHQFEKQQQQNEEQLRQQQKQIQQHQQQIQQQQQQKQPAQQIQASVMTGAATLGSFMAGGAKKLGSFFGAAAAAVATPAVTQQPPITATVTTAQINQFTSGVAPTMVLTTASVPDTTIVPQATEPSVTSATTTAATLPRTPSLRRQESIQRPSVGRTRTLPDAPDDFTSSFDESAYDEEYQKTELDQVDRDRTSLDRYRDEDFTHDTILEDVPEERKVEETAPSIKKTTSPPRTGSITRKPSVDSYHSQTPSVLDRKTSQSSFISHQEEKLSSHASQEENTSDKSKVTFQDERTTYHEVPDETAFHERQESFDQGGEFQDDEQFQDDEYRDEKFEEQEQEQYQEEFPEEERKEELEFEPEQPKLTPKQRWHRAYNKIVMQLNIARNKWFSHPAVK
ncbi:unnamed protein product [Pieris brassicae]|uniref:Uncharacterized protein n=1 Tax=Pieris brassicae TaxID=7116 RepID=A0A9P0X8S0_PIEBR|nr:unnamed protein product [Pieris brassicae]